MAFAKKLLKVRLLSHASPDVLFRELTKRKYPDVLPNHDAVTLRRSNFTVTQLSRRNKP